MLSWLQSKYALSSFLPILIYTHLSSLKFMVLLNIPVKCDKKKALSISALSTFSASSGPLFFCSSYFFKDIYVTFSWYFYTFLADCLDIILTHLIFPLHLVGHQPPNGCCSTKLWVSKSFIEFDPVALAPFMESDTFEYQIIVFKRHFNKLPCVSYKAF